MSASREDCPCCDANVRTPATVDDSMVSAFLAGVAASDSRVSIKDALCAKHGKIAADCIAFVNAAVAQAQEPS